MTEFVTLALWGLAGSLAVALPVWVASLARRDASLIDRYWPWLIAVPALIYAAALPTATTPQGALMLGLLLLWAVRLSVYLTWRNWGHGEDRRYQALRARNQPNFGRKSLYLVFGLQAVLGWVVAMPVLAAFAGMPYDGAQAAAAQALSGHPVLHGFGALLAASGLVIETAADAQMARFRANPAHRGQVMDRGLWRWSRHPNYFGDACVWWGVWMMALGSAGATAAWSVISPLLMTVLLLKVSGVTLLEQDISDRRPAYRDYILRTSAFIPWPPRRQP